MSIYHHRSAQIVGDQILRSWRNNSKWTNSFISKNVQQSMTPSDFPSPDINFQDSNKRTSLSLEFKPYTETKRGIMTGLGQCIAYLKKVHASILVCPKKIDYDFEMGTFMKEIFEKFIYGKLPIALFTFEGEQIENLKLVTNIDPKLFEKKFLPYKGTGNPYWSFWRDLSPDGFFKLAKSSEAVKENKDRSKKVWDFFWDNYYAPIKSRETLGDVESNIFQFNYKDKLLPFSDRKRDLRKKVDDRLLTIEKALNELELFGWSKDVVDNNYKNYKKNHYNFMNHNKLWDENFKLTLIGKKFIDRFGILNNVSEKNDEFAQILLVQGKHHNLIEEIKNITAEIEIPDTDEDFRLEIYKKLDQKGYVAKNTNRKTSGIRKPFIAETQLWAHLNIIKLNNEGRYKFFFKDKGYQFNDEKINNLVNQFYVNYGNVLEEFNVRPDLLN